MVSWTAFPRILFPLWFWIRVGHRRYLHKIVEVKLSNSLLHALQVAVGHCGSPYIWLPTHWLTFLVWGSTQTCSSSSSHLPYFFTFQGQVWVQPHGQRCQLLQVTHLIKIRVTKTVLDSSLPLFSLTPCPVPPSPHPALSQLTYNNLCSTPGARALWGPCYTLHITCKCRTQDIHNCVRSNPY